MEIWQTLQVKEKNNKQNSSEIWKVLIEDWASEMEIKITMDKEAFNKKKTIWE